VESAENCEALSDSLRELLPRLAGAVASSGVAAAEIAIAEDLSGTRRLARAVLPEEAGRRDANRLFAALSDLFDGVRIAAADGPILAGSGESRLWLPVQGAGRAFPLTAETFFQANRHLLASLYAEARREAAPSAPGRALDLFSGVGFFAAALLDAGHEVVSVEADHAAVEQAEAAKKRWGAPDKAWKIEHSEALEFLGRNQEIFDLAIADPPRAGLGLPLCRALAGRVRRLLYVSCEPATLARDLEALVAAGLHIRGGKLYDLFPLTHRVEAVVALSPPRTP
jgi:tRNA/tmRNA/rRNA uracil-C5-methylase (TrmA/RlmC/RlmD family)